ncbi:MAG: cupin domain-containing protein [Pseudomonadota bacterium]
MSTDQILAEIVLPTGDFRADLAFFTDTLGLRLDAIWPADDPTNARLSGYGVRLHLDAGTDLAPGLLRIQTDRPDELFPNGDALTAPNGTRIEPTPLTPPLEVPRTAHEFVVRRLRDSAPWVIGRAGMHYRDLIPSRLGGSIIASHIRIPDGGPVPDMVHYHTVGFQLIYCYAGWVDVLYEDQGDMIRLTAGDCVTQPPEIRHRVCHASPDIEVIEIGVPAEHVTTIDHTLTLPNGVGDPAREWQGQRFVHHRRADAHWAPFRIPGFEARDTGIAEGTKGIAGIQVARISEGVPAATRHDADIHFTFVLSGGMSLTAEGQAPHGLETGDAFVVPPGLATRYADCTPDLELLEVALRGDFASEVVASGD